MSLDHTIVFNRKLKEFMAALTETFPEIQDFSTLLALLKLVGTITPVGMPVSVFNQHVVEPYGDSILKKDEQFFLQQDYSSHFGANTAASNQGFNMNIVDKLKGVWSTLDAGNKDTIWQYLQVLTILAKRCKLT